MFDGKSLGSVRLREPHIYFFNHIKKETPAQVFSFEFYKIFKNICFAEYLLKATLMIWLLLDSFVSFIVHLNEKLNDISDNCFLKTFMYLLNVFNESYYHYTNRFKYKALLFSEKRWFFKNIENLLHTLKFSLKSLEIF